MNIYGAKTHVDKLYQFIESLQVSDKQLYQKSKDKLQYIAGVCANIIGTICEIVEDDCLASDTNIDEEEQFYESDTEDISNILDSVYQELDKLKQFVGNSPKPRQDTYKLPSSSSKIERIETLKQYSSILEQMRSQDLPPSLQEFSSILFDWYNIRIKNNPSKDFHYNINQLPNWITSWVIAYSIHISDKSSLQFKQMVDNWLNNIRDGNNYALPYEVYKINIGDVEPDSITCQSLILWESLFVRGMNQLSNVPAVNSRISLDTMKNHLIKILGQEKYMEIEELFYKKVGK